MQSWPLVWPSQRSESLFQSARVGLKESCFLCMCSSVWILWGRFLYTWCYLSHLSYSVAGDHMDVIRRSETCLWRQADLSHQNCRLFTWAAGDSHSCYSYSSGDVVSCHQLLLPALQVVCFLWQPGEPGQGRAGTGSSKKLGSHTQWWNFVLKGWRQLEYAA